jgi:hypothetical protein
LCNEAEGGSALIREAFAEGTEPEKNCDCHVKYAFCKESKKLAAEDCPKVYYRVLLQKTETSQTEDFKNTVEQNITEDTCDVHRSKDE